MRPLPRKKKKKPGKRTLVCPNCGASFPEGRLSCPECGSDAQTGWKSREEIDYQSVELPEWDEDPRWTPEGPRAWIPRAPGGRGRFLGRIFFWVVLAALIFTLAALDRCT